MKKFIIVLIITLTCNTVFADTDIEKVLKDVNEAGRLAEQEVAKFNLSTKRGRLCYGRDGFTRDMVEERKKGISQEEIQAEIFHQFNSNQITLDVFTEMTTLLKGVYIIPDEIIYNKEKFEEFMKNTYWFCMNAPN